MTVDYGGGVTEYGPGVLVTLDGDELAEAVDAFLLAKGVLASGPRTVRVNGGPCESASVYVDPSGRVLVGGMPFSGRGPDTPAVGGEADDCYITGVIGRELSNGDQAMRLSPKPVPTSYGVGYSWLCDYYAECREDYADGGDASSVPMAVFQRFEPFPKPPWTLHRTVAEANAALLAAWDRLPAEGRHLLPEFASKVEALRVVDLLAPVGPEDRLGKRCYCGLLAVDDGRTCVTCRNVPSGS